MDAIPVTGVSELVLEVVDLERSERFYSVILGFPVVDRWPDRDVVWVMAGDRTRIGLWKPQVGLFGSRGGANPPSITIVDDTGAVRLDRELDPDVVGEEITPNAYLVTPHGVLYFAASSEFYAVQQLVAVELGVGAPAESSDPLITWANDAATWH